MNKNNLEFDVVCVDQKNLESLIVFQINRISCLVQKTTVGQFIKSVPFQLNFPASIGKSKWVLILFLNGQYEAGQPNDLITIYLNLIQCERQSAEFKFDAKFQFGCESTTTAKINQRLCFASVTSRWIGAKLIKISEMILNESQFIRDDVLMLTVSLDEHLKKDLSLSPEAFYNGNYSFLSQSYVKSENKYSDPPVRSSKSVPSSAEKSYNIFRKEPYVKAENNYIDPPAMCVPSAEKSYNMFIEESNVKTERKSVPSPKWSSTSTSRNSLNSLQSTDYDSYPSRAKMQRSDNASASTNGTGLAYQRNIICDSNLNYVDHEFSDDEDGSVKSTDSKSGLRNFFAATIKKFFGE